jgi:hypothetical protein
MTEESPPGDATDRPEPAAAPAAAPPSYWVRPDQRPKEPRWGPPAPTPMPEGPPPGMREIVSRGIDLDVALSRDIRQQSLFVGWLFLAALGPIAVAVIARSAALGGFDWLADAFDETRLYQGRGIGLDPSAGFALFLAIAVIGAISIDVQLMVTALLGSRIGGRHIDLRGTIAWARHGFWRLVFASLTVGLMLLIPRQLVSLVLTGSDQVRLLAGTIVDLLLSMPFAYVGAAVVLAGAGPFQAVRLSWRIARRRWRLAFVVGIVNTAVSYLASFALGAAADILGRILIALGVDQEFGALQAVEVLLISLVALAAIGSLTLTVAALSTAPQIIAWTRLGGPTMPLIRPGSEPPWEPHRRVRLVSLPMQLALLASGALAFIAAVHAAS